MKSHCTNCPALLTENDQNVNQQLEKLGVPTQDLWICLVCHKMLLASEDKDLTREQKRRKYETSAKLLPLLVATSQRRAREEFVATRVASRVA